MVAYDQAAWHALFTGAIGASAALTGLLFVAISINLDQILKFPQLPGRAAGTLGTLLASLSVSGFALAPGQSIRVLGWEIIAVGAVVGLQALVVTLRNRGLAQKITWIIAHLVSLFFPALIFIAGGVSLVTQSGGGLYWILTATLVVFVVSSINAWVLLVEIKR
jgi:hypothetical protein